MCVTCSYIATCKGIDKSRNGYGCQQTDRHPDRQTDRQTAVFLQTRHQAPPLQTAVFVENPSEVEVVCRHRIEHGGAYPHPPCKQSKGNSSKQPSATVCIPLCSGPFQHPCMWSCAQAQSADCAIRQSMQSQAMAVASSAVSVPMT